MEVITINDINVPPVKGLFSNSKANGEICSIFPYFFLSFNNTEPFSLQKGNVFITKDNRKHLLRFVNCTLKPEG